MKASEHRVPTRLAACLVGVASCTLCLACAGASPADAADVRNVQPFLKQHCFDCHGNGVAEGGLDLSTLGTNVDDIKRFARWERVFDRVQAGEMPPPSATQPKAADREAFLKTLGAELTTAHAAAKQTVLRRLNRYEYQNTLNDLFGTNLKLAERLPQDGRSHEFENVGSALGLSLVQMQRYLEAIDAVLDAAIVRSLGPPEPRVVRASYADTRGGEQWLGKIWLKRDDGAVVFYKAFGYPTGMLREANVSQDGWYNVRVTGYAFQSERPVTFSVGAVTFARGLEQPTFGYYSLPPGEPTTVEVRAWIPARYMIDVTPYGITDRNNEVRLKGVQDYRGPGLAIQHIEVEGPLTDEFPSRGHRLLFDGLNRVEVPPRNPNDRLRPNYVPRFEIQSDNPSADVTPVLTRVAAKAFRRPVTAERVQPLLDLFEREHRQGATLEEALRTSVAAIFCAPDFLYLLENPGRLDDYALAARLSYFLTRTAPDDELLSTAATRQLASNPQTLAAQAERLLRHPHFSRFIADFTDAWLNLREIDFTNPDSILFPEFDPYLKWSMLAESRAFFRKLVDDNLGVTNLVKSDFAMLNERLAEHYGVAGVQGPEIQPVSLSQDSVRGGVLGQAAVLKVSANGTNTSPVVRGVWVMDRLLGQPPQPPPPGVPGVEPDIRGASTLRELLDKHRTQDNCRGCHQQIDPPGFALESFDPVGAWRERFRSLGDGDRVDIEVRGMRVRYRWGPPVDASGQLPDGQTFAGFREFRSLLAQRRSQLAKAFTTKLLTFATGREMGFSDRPEIDRIVQQSAASDHGVRDLIRLVVQSDIFRSK